MLEKRILEKGMELEGLKYYVESFRHGVSPHAGAGIGLERVVFLYLGESGDRDRDKKRRRCIYRDGNREIYPFLLANT